MAITPSNYSYRQLITGASPSATNSGQVLLIDENSVDSTFFSNAQNGGGDIRVCENSDGTSQLPIEVVTCDTTGNVLQVWVRKPTYSSASRGLYIFCGTATTDSQPAVTDTYGRNNVWQDFEYANHLDNTGLLNSANGNTGTFESGTPTSATAKIGDGRDFTSEGIATGESLLNTASNFRLSAWVDWQGTVSSDEDAIFDSWDFGDLAFYLRYDSLNAEIDFTTNTTGGGTQVLSVSQSLNGAGLTKIDAVYTGSTKIVYVNGVALTPTQSASGNINNILTAPMKIGRSIANNSGNDFWRGIIDEATVGSAKTASYIATEYDNQNNTSTFWTQGTPDDPSAGGGTISVTGATPSYSYSAINGTVELTGEITVTGATPSYSYSAVNGVVDLTPEITITGQTPSYSYGAVNGVVTLTPTGQINVTGQTPSYSYSAIDATVLLQGTITVTGATPTYAYTAISATVQLGELDIVTNFSGTVKQSEFSGSIKTAQFLGAIKDASFSGNIKQSNFIGVRR